MIQQYIEEQEGEPVADNSRFQIDPSYTPRLIDKERLVEEIVMSSCPEGRVPDFINYQYHP